MTNDVLLITTQENANSRNDIHITTIYFTKLADPFSCLSNNLLERNTNKYLR